MAVWMIAWSNVKRKKGVALSMGILIALSVAMLNLGTTLLTGLQTYYNQANEDLNGAHYMVRFTANEYKDEYLDFFLNDSRVSAAQTEEIIIMDSATFPEGGALSVTFLQMDDSLKVSGYQVSKLADVPVEQAVYVPEFFREEGYKPGDAFTLNYLKQSYTFYIEGFSQSTWLSSSVNSLVDFYMPTSAYEALYRQIGGGYLLSVRVHDLADVASLQKDFREQTDVKIESATMDSLVMDFTLDDMRTGATMIVAIVSAILLAFSILILLVSMLVIRFRIANHIETQMHNIGALGALGYTGTQICRSIALEFFIMGICGALAGIVISYGMLGALGTFITQSVGIKWQAGLHIKNDVLSAVLVTCIVFLVSQLSARKAARILPVLALRGGIESHSFAKNHIPLDKTRCSLTAALGLKHIFFQLKTNLMVGAVFTGVAFALSSALVIFLNMGLDQSLLTEMSGYEISDVMVYAAPHADYGELVSDIQKMEGVRKTTFMETTSLTIDNELLTGYVSDDYSRLETITAYEGSLPVYDNEVVITGVLAQSLGKRIGDTVEIKSGGLTADYMICGLTQAMSNFGRQCYVSLDGVLRLNPTYKRQTIQVYLNPDMEIDTFIAAAEQNFKVITPSIEVSAEEGTDKRLTARQKAEEKMTRLLSMYDVDSAQFALMKDGAIILSGDTLSYQIDHLENNRNLFSGSINSISSASAIIAAVILTGTLLIVILVFYMVIKSMLVQRSREFGIYKANGYTNRQLMAQIAVGFMPSVTVGTALGCVLTCICINPLASALFRGVGVSHMNFALHPGILAVAGLLLTAFSFLICMIMAWKIRKISVYTLLTE